ncbi:BTB/POZ domain-containing protein KCTD9 [Amphibalanus amphitrite]|uniref:BTB/POZ domain-containing protein KCTD9 n=1 Tax=Amphibalanus amphitrite TaxID=1232801 RepID=A0A6A4WKZ9_AMPAM|nr:BTB/POZ domain-containing protein KCTD9 [Amphibalanus amphitrite]
MVGLTIARVAPQHGYTHDLHIQCSKETSNCNLSGSDLHEANLRGANLTNTAFDLMLTPIHMSQTVR